MILETKESEFNALFTQFVDQYAKGPKGTHHLALYDSCRGTGRANFEAIQSDRKKGEDVTDRILKGLLPHTETTSHRASGAWISIAPAIQGDIKEWYEKVGWTRPEDWPKVAEAIIIFIERCVDNPNGVAASAEEFTSLPYTNGLQTGLLTPILNALAPEHFIILNKKSRKVLNYFTGKNFKHSLTNYQEANMAGRALIESVTPSMRKLSGSDARPCDLFDMFCHWLVAVHKYGPLTRIKKIKTGDREVSVSVPEDAAEEAPPELSPATPNEPRLS
jgi:5-methylcytosine-specific restriction protein B